jgi:hypothetical protein
MYATVFGPLFLAQALKRFLFRTSVFISGIVAVISIIIAAQWLLNTNSTIVLAPRAFYPRLQRWEMIDRVYVGDGHPTSS